MERRHLVDSHLELRRFRLHLRQHLRHSHKRFWRVYHTSAGSTGLISTSSTPMSSSNSTKPRLFGAFRGESPEIPGRPPAQGLELPPPLHGRTRSSSRRAKGLGQGLETDLQPPDSGHYRLKTLPKWWILARFCPILAPTEVDPGPPAGLRLLQPPLLLGQLP